MTVHKSPAMFVPFYGFVEVEVVELPALPFPAAGGLFTVVLVVVFGVVLAEELCHTKNAIMAATTMTAIMPMVATELPPSRTTTSRSFICFLAPVK